MRSFINVVLTDAGGTPIVKATVLRPVISIILTKFSVFPQRKNVHNVFQITARENPSVLLTPDFQIHFLRLSEVHQGKAEAIILILTRRFGTVPQSLQDNLLAMTDVDQLEKLGDLVLDCDSLADFEKGLV